MEPPYKIDKNIFGKKNLIEKMRDSEWNTLCNCNLLNFSLTRRFHFIFLELPPDSFPHFVFFAHCEALLWIYETFSLRHNLGVTCLVLFLHPLNTNEYKNSWAHRVCHFQFIFVFRLVEIHSSLGRQKSSNLFMSQINFYRHNIRGFPWLSFEINLRGFMYIGEGPNLLSIQLKWREIC